MRMILVTLKTPDGAEIEMEYETDIALVRGLNATATLISQCGGLKEAIKFSMEAAKAGLVNGLKP